MVVVDSGRTYRNFFFIIVINNIKKLSTNRILKDMRVPGSKILADDEVIYEEGNWVIPDKA